MATTVINADALARATQLTMLRDEIKTLDDAQASDFISKAIEYSYKNNIPATEKWLEMCLERVNEIGAQA